MSLGWRFAPAHPDPGPAPAPPDRTAHEPGWMGEQRRRHQRTVRPNAAGAGALALVALVLLVTSPAGVVFAVALLVAAGFLARRALEAHRVLRRLAEVAASTDPALRAAEEEYQREHAEWQRRRTEFEAQRAWYQVSLPTAVARVDVVGSTPMGWAGLITMLAAERLDAGGQVTVVDLTEGAVAGELVESVRSAGPDPAVWVLPDDLASLGLGTGLDARSLAAVLARAAHDDDTDAHRDISTDERILHEVLKALDEISIARITAALRLLAQIGEPAGTGLSATEVDRVGRLFGQGALAGTVLERAFTLEARLRELEGLGTDPASTGQQPLQVLALSRTGTPTGNRVIAGYLLAALVHDIRRGPAGADDQARWWDRTLVVCGCERLSPRLLDQLDAACEATRTGLVLTYRTLAGPAAERIGRGNSATVFMRLGNGADARLAAEHIGTEHRFVLSALTESVGQSTTDTTGGSYTSTHGEATSKSRGKSTRHGRARERERSDDSTATTTRSKSTERSTSYRESVSSSTSWGASTARATGTTQGAAQTLHRARELLVEPHQLQQLPLSALILNYSDPATGRAVILADANPAIAALPQARVR